jgi:hypothetical protein
MIGGRFSFAGGGWSGSAVAGLLPVTMEMKEEHRKLAVAMAIVMDRSGSMAMTAPGTGRTKMSLADDGAARSIELLGESDFVAVIPVDSAPHPLSDGLVAVGPNRQRLISATRRVTSGGGGIFCYTGLKAAWSMLEGAEVGQRHVILFADAMDAEEPGDYQNLLAEMAAEKCTVSVIGLGTDKDVDAAFLQDIATRGGGRIFFNADATELPALRVSRQPLLRKIHDAVALCPHHKHLQDLIRHATQFRDVPVPVTPAFHIALSKRFHAALMENVDQVGCLDSIPTGKRQFLQQSPAHGIFASQRLNKVNQRRVKHGEQGSHQDLRNTATSLRQLQTTFMKRASIEGLHVAQLLLLQQRPHQSCNKAFMEIPNIPIHKHADVAVCYE